MELCGDARPADSLTEPLPQPVRLDPLGLETTPNSLCTLTGQFPLSRDRLASSEVTLQCVLRGREPHIFQMEVHGSSVSAGCHCVGLRKMKTCESSWDSYLIFSEQCLFSLRLQISDECVTL